MPKRIPATPSFFAAQQLPIPYAPAPYPAGPPPFSDEAAKKPAAVPANFDIRVSVKVDRDATVATADLNESGMPYAVPLARATGSAVRQREDVHDPETATLLAVSRALGKLSAKMNKKARGRIKSADSARKDRERSKARKQRLVSAAAVTVITGGATADGTIIVNTPEDDLPDSIKSMVRSLFPARDIQFVDDGSISAPELIEQFLTENGAGGQYRGQHVKPEDGQDG